MSESNTTTKQSTRESKADREARKAAEAEAAAQAAESQAIQARYEQFESLVTNHTRVRVHFEDRKMAVPGRIKLTSERRPLLVTNWGLELDLTHEPVTVIETKNLDSGKFEAIS